MTASSPLAFTYPAATDHRRHGPFGYSDYASYRPWLRDEFEFRCVCCLLRERWGRLKGEFDLDHFVPQSIDPSQATAYDNLLYACHSCNAKKGSLALGDAERLLVAESIRVGLDGRLIGRTPEAERLIDAMTLNSSQWVLWRLSWIRIIDLTAERDPELYRQLMGCPDELPNLSELKPPANSRPDGIEQSSFARRQRGELLKLFPEVRPNRGFDWEKDASNDVNPSAPTKNGTSTSEGNDPEVLTEDGLVCMAVRKAPRPGHYSKQGLIELGAYEINKLRRPTTVPFYPWLPVSGVPKPVSKPKSQPHDRLKLAREYQAILDSGEGNRTGEPL